MFPYRPGPCSRLRIPRRVSWLAPLAAVLLVPFAARRAAADPPPFAFAWPSETRSLAVDADGRLYANKGAPYASAYTRDGNLLFTYPFINTQTCNLYRMTGVAAGAAGFVVGCTGYCIQAYDGSGNAVWQRIGGANGVAVDAAGYVFAATYEGSLLRYTPDGELRLSWGGSTTDPFRLVNPGAIAVSGNLVYVADTGRNRIVRFDRDLHPIDTWSLESGGTQFRAPTGVAVDGHGRLYVTTASPPRILRLSATGTVEEDWGDAGSGEAEIASPTDVAVNASGDVYVADPSNHKILMFGTRLPSDDPPPLPTPPPPPPPPPPPVPPPTITSNLPAAVVLHVTSVDDPDSCLGPESPAGVVTAADAAPSGLHYRVYMMVHPDSRTRTVQGLTGLQVGIRYPEAQGHQGIEVTGWHRCSMLDFPLDPWPRSGSGNTITWGRGYCQLRDLVVFGWFDVVAYTPGAFSVIAHPATDRAKYSNCEAAESELPVDPDRLGWISFGGAPLGDQSAGCNPMLRSCGENTVPVEPTTWSRIKTGFLREE